MLMDPKHATKLWIYNKELYVVRLNATNVRMYVHYTNIFPKQVNPNLGLNYNNPAPILELFIIPNEWKKNENEGKGKRLTVGQ